MGDTHMPSHACGGQRAMWESKFPPSTVWVLEIKLRPSCLALCAITTWTIFPALPLFLAKRQEESESLHVSSLLLHFSGTQRGLEPALSLRMYHSKKVTFMYTCSILSLWDLPGKALTSFKASCKNITEQVGTKVWKHEARNQTDKSDNICSYH